MVTDTSALTPKFDGLFSNNVIEHFRTPVTQFRAFRDRLKPSGRMAHSTPCYRYLYPITRFHTVFLGRAIRRRARRENRLPDFARGARTAST